MKTRRFVKGNNLFYSSQVGGAKKSHKEKKMERNSMKTYENKTLRIEVQSIIKYKLSIY